MKPISIWGWLGGHDGQRPRSKFDQDVGITPRLFLKDNLGFLMTTESGPQFNISSEGRKGLYFPLGNTWLWTWLWCIYPQLSFHRVWQVASVQLHTSDLPTYLQTATCMPSSSILDDDFFDISLLALNLETPHVPLLSACKVRYHSS